MGWVICVYLAYIQFWVQVSYRKTYTGTNIQKLIFSMLSSSSFSPKGKYKEERVSYFLKHWTPNGRKYSKTLLWLVDFQRAYIPKCQPSREKTKRKLEVLLLWEPPSQMYIQLMIKIKHMRYGSHSISCFFPLNCRWWTLGTFHEFKYKGNKLR